MNGFLPTVLQCIKCHRLWTFPNPPPRFPRCLSCSYRCCFDHCQNDSVECDCTGYDSQCMFPILRVPFCPKHLQEFSHLRKQLCLSCRHGSLYRQWTCEACLEFPETLIQCKTCTRFTCERKKCQAKMFTRQDMFIQTCSHCLDKFKCHHCSEIARELTLCHHCQIPCCLSCRVLYIVPCGTHSETQYTCYNCGKSDKHIRNVFKKNWYTYFCDKINCIFLPKELVMLVRDYILY